MLYEAIDTIVLACDDPAVAAVPYERLGLCLSGYRLHVGDPSNLSVLELVGPNNPLFSRGRPVPPPGALAAVALRVPDLDAALQELATKGVIDAIPIGGVALWRGVWLPLDEQAGTDLVLLQRRLDTQQRHASVEQQGLLAHKLPLQRLDHLAAVTLDLDDKTRFWTDVLGVPVSGEVVTPNLIIRQLKIGDAVLELLGAASADSPLHKRPPGLVSMASWQVPDLDAAVSHARGAGFTVTDAAGVLPGTRVATVQGSELSGVNMQLLQYV